MPWFYELGDRYAYKPRIDLRPGWNQLLLKIEHDVGRFGRVSFTLRLSNADGTPAPGLLFSSRPGQPEQLRVERDQATALQERWYRLQVPPGTHALWLPGSPAFRALYLNGRPITATTESRIEYGNLDWNHPNVIAMVTSAANELDTALQFETALTQYHLGSWTWTGLSSLSGEAAYEKTFRVDPSFLGKRIELDLGQVGVTAEVWVNDKRVGERVWAPFQFDVSQYLHSGENRVKIAVTNSDSNRRAEADAMRYIQERDLPGGRAAVYMESLSLNGLIGPVTLVPYEQIDLHIPQ
jgi:hypothetical protein